MRHNVRPRWAPGNGMNAFALITFPRIESLTIGST